MGSFSGIRIEFCAINFILLQQLGGENKKWHYQVDSETPEGKSYIFFFPYSNFL